MCKSLQYKFSLLDLRHYDPRASNQKTENANVLEYLLGGSVLRILKLVKLF